MSIKRHIPNTITSLNLLSGALGVIFTIEGRVDVAFPLMLAGAFFDFFDGMAARLLDVKGEMGKELDSLADMVSFGLLPSVMMYETMRLAGCTCVLAYFCLILAVLSGIRLAKFNVDTRQESDFIGVATPTAAILCASLCYFIAVSPASEINGWIASSWFLPALALVMGLLLLSEIPMFSMKVAKGHKLFDAKRIAFLSLSLVAGIIVIVFHLNWSLFVLLTFTIYLLVNLFVAFLNLFRK